MAATAWSFYNSFREYIGNGQFDLDGTSVGFYLALHTSAASALVNTNTLSTCLLYTSPSPRDRQKSRMPSSA